VFFSVNAVKQLLQSFCLLLSLGVSDNLNNAGVFLGDLDNGRISVEELHSENLIPHSVLILVFSLQNRNNDILSRLIVLESEGAFDRGKVAVRQRLVFESIENDSLVFDSDYAVASVDSLHSNDAFFGVCGVFERLLLSEDQLAGPVVVHNCHPASSIFPL